MDQIINILAERLEGKGIEAAKIPYGFNLFLKNQFDLVITDFEMPGMDGIELAIRIKEKSPFTLVILMTGHEKNFTLAKLSGTLVDQALFKPFSLQEISEKIQSLQNRRHSVNLTNQHI